MILIDLFLLLYTDISNIKISNQIKTNNIEINNVTNINKIEKNTINKDTFINNNIVDKKNIDRQKYYLSIWHKDDLFKYQWWILETYINWWIKLIDYSEKRDIEDRDIIDVDRVYDKYVEKINDKNKNDIFINTPYGWTNYWEVKDNNIKNENIELIVLYFHGAWWNRHQWVNDYTFWWNFNRIQNLMIKNNGVYISPDFKDFEWKWTVEMQILIYHLLKKYPNWKLIISWASSGWTILWNIVNKSEKKLVDKISGLLLIWSVTNSKYNINNRIPIYIWHWTKDSNISYKPLFSYYNEIKKQNSIYPIKIELFKNWVHWTPIRMINWRDSINWILLNKK